MKISVNEKWVKKVSFTEFLKDSNIKKLPKDEAQNLYEHLTGKKVKAKKIGGGE